MREPLCWIWLCVFADIFVYGNDYYGISAVAMGLSMVRGDGDSAHLWRDSPRQVGRAPLAGEPLRCAAGPVPVGRPALGAGERARPARRPGVATARAAQHGQRVGLHEAVRFCESSHVT